jgi:acetylornithine deacetylase/succinyl-diaminopimelate desuccinylase-like protein
VNDFVMPLMLNLDISSLTMSLVNIASASGAETSLADSVEVALRTVAHLDVDRVGDTVIARTDAGHSERVIVAGHLGTGPSEEDPLAYVEMGKLFGPGASDAKGALAASLKAAAAGGYGRDVTFVYYAGGQDSEWWRTCGDDLLPADFGLLAEPTTSAVSGGALDHPRARRLIGLTDIDPASDASDAHGLARFASLGIPAVAFGPGDPSVAGAPGEFVPTAQLTQCEFVLRQWLTG